MGEKLTPTMAMFLMWFWKPDGWVFAYWAAMLMENSDPLLSESGFVSIVRIENFR